ncbi:unnamed protein product [Durusdinium trenchii]|uniref:VWFA domain-containing protein n=1 Tax=Durusdinium trenchii TaxID=1381693 RepID=A0ABP0SM40_9DINO
MKTVVLALWAILLLLLARVIDRARWRTLPRQRLINSLRLAENSDLVEEENRRLQYDENESDWNSSNETSEVNSTTSTSSTVTSTSSTQTLTTSTDTVTTRTRTTSTRTTRTRTSSTSSSVTRTSSTSSSVTRTTTSSTKTTVTVTSSTSSTVTSTSSTVTTSSWTSTSSTATSTSTWSTTSTTTLWGDVLLALDFTVHPPERWQLQHFAAELALNVSQSVLAESQKRVHFGVVLFGQDVSYFPLPVDEAKLNNLVLDPELGAQVSPRPPRYTHEALSLCESVLTGRYAQVQVVVILTNGLSADPVLTRRSAQDLHARQVRLFSVGMDNVSDRQSVRWMELEDLTLKQHLQRTRADATNARTRGALETGETME